MSKPPLRRLAGEILASVRIQEDRWASLPAVIQSPPPRPNCAWVRAGKSPKRRTACRFFMKLPLDPKAIEHAVERADVHAAVGDGEAAPVIPALDFVLARPELCPRLRVEGVEHRVGGTGDAAIGGIGQSDIRVGLIRILAAAVGEDYPVGDDRRLGAVHIARDPGGSKLPLSALLLDSESNDGAVLDFAVLDGRLEFGMLRSPDRRQHPAGALGILPTRQRAPDSRRGEIHVLIAEQRAAI